MIENPLNIEERRLLLRLARQTIEQAVCGCPCPLPELDGYSPALCEKGATFVTLTLRDGELRGCIGTLEARLPLAHDVCEHARAAALEDYRFMPVRPEEVALLRIEISRLTLPRALEYEHPLDILRLLKPFEDGVVLHDGQRRATFLPQVWEKLPSADSFLNHLCQKMGVSSDLWRKKKMQVEIYKIEEFHEEETQDE